jgi:signal transduction histidine kinase
MRRRLALLVAATTSVVLLAFLLPAAVLVSRAAESTAVSSATGRSQAVVSAVAAGADRAEVDALAQQLADLGLTVTVSEEATTTRARATVTRTGDGAALLRQPVLVDDRVLVVETVVPRDQLRDGVTRAWSVLGLLGVVLIVLSLLVADRLARTITRPITELAGTADRLAHGDLSARVEPSGPPEVREVGSAINLLAGRISELLASEREAVADLSHRLRTPITALRLDVDSLPPGPERERLAGSVDELTRQEARADARAVVAERVAFWTPLAEEEGREVQLQLADQPCPVRTSPGDLEAALDALLGNVIAHTPEGTTLTVALRPDGDGALIVVSDEGPGFADNEVVRRGESRAGSTGLGLDIARRTAAASGGDLRIGRAPGGGARVSMRLGPPVG